MTLGERMLHDRPSDPSTRSSGAPIAYGYIDRSKGVSVETFEEFGARVRGRVEGWLEPWLQARVARAAARGADVEVVADAVRTLILRGGKRLRAVLLAASFEACGGARDAAAATIVAAAGASLELLQGYLLVHDDLMDGDETRRGGPSVPAVLRDRFAQDGDAASIVAGDLACAWSQSALLGLDVDPARLVLAARELALVQEEVVAGQMLDVRGEASDASQVEVVHALKTASYTARGPVAIGARLAGARESQVAALTAFAKPLGIAFQLRDDVLGTFGNEHAMGKPQGSDLRKGKRTALVVEAMNDATAWRSVARVLGHGDANADEMNEAIASLQSCGARARVEARIETLLRAAREALDGAELTPNGRELLASAAVAMTDRER
jgi:geranylgeranyl diphosphate synthase type I